MRKNINTAPIGIFDSGIGGLTVVRELLGRLPNENIVYLGDTARVPYGTKSGETVIKYSHSNADFLVSKDIKFLVVACNTASSVSIPSLNEKLEIPVIGVIDPGARKAAEITKSGRVGVIGTPSTIRSSAYTKAIHRHSAEIEVYTQDCPLFVPLADEGWTEGEITEQIAEQYLGSLKEKDIDVLVLGCTHYPLLKNTIQKVMGDRIILVDSAQETALEIDTILSDKELLNDNHDNADRQFYLTDVSETFISVAGRFLGQKIDGIELVDIVGTAK